MAALSIEMNRLLGSALLDPTIQSRIFSEGRADVLKGFSLSQPEYAMVMDSKAHTLADLASDICTKASCTNGRPSPAWLSTTGEVDVRYFRKQTDPDSTLMVAPMLQRLYSDLAAQLTNLEPEYNQGYHVA